MTEDKNFKNKVKAVAEWNGLTYTQAKKACIAAKEQYDPNGPRI